MAIGYHKITGCKVAIKAIETATYERLSIENKVSEAQATLLCEQSEHVVNLIEEFHYQDDTFLVTKLAKGGDLLTYCLAQQDETNWMCEQRAKHIFLQIAHGVRHMHALGILHRDLKLLNIFMCDVSAFPRVKIGDLGLACKLGVGESIVKKAGTLAFMAPEVLLLQPCDFKSEIYSLGILLYTLIASRLPFESDYYSEEFKTEILRWEIPYEGPAWLHVDPNCINLLKQMLVRNPEHRINIE